MWEQRLIKAARIPAKRSQSDPNEEEKDDEMNHETDEVLIRISLRWHSAEFFTSSALTSLPLLDDRQPPRVPCCMAFSIM